MKRTLIGFIVTVLCFATETRLPDARPCGPRSDDIGYPALITAAPPDAEYTVGTDTLPYWTGTCTRDDVNELYGKSDNTIKVEHIIWTGVPPAETTRCGWVKFNTSSIPDSATILRARIRHMVHFWQFSFDFQFTAVTVDPVTASARTLFPAIEDGTVCADVPALGHDRTQFLGSCAHQEHPGPELGGLRAVGLRLVARAHREGLDNRVEQQPAGRLALVGRQLLADRGGRAGRASG